MSFHRLTFVLVAILLNSEICLASSGNSVTSFDDIEFWVGSGTNSAALAIDWDGESSGDEAYVWGYHWDDSVSGVEMLVDVLSADARLFAKLGIDENFGGSIIGLGYDQNDDGQFALSDNSLFDERGINASNLSDLETSDDPADFYAEGWFLGFWHLGIATDSPFDGGTWQHTFAGIDDIAVADNSWLSIAFTSDTFSTSDFAENPIAAEALFSADFDADDDVDGSDFLTWQRGFGVSNNASPEQGDANDDGAIDQLDLQLWAAAFDSSAFYAVRAIPEPSSKIFVFFALLLFLGTGFFGTGRTLWRSF